MAAAALESRRAESLRVGDVIYVLGERLTVAALGMAGAGVEARCTDESVHVFPRWTLVHTERMAR
jgi:hypothetical protein